MKTLKHKKQEGTKGVLNMINERYGCNQKRRTIPIQALIRFHAPKQQAELTALIESHQDGHIHANCPCGCKSAGTVKTFADRLFKAYNTFKEKVDNNVEYKDWEDCYTFMHSLFVSNSLRGNMVENDVLNNLQSLIKRLGYNFKAELASSVADFKYAIDLSIYDDNNNEIFAVQVKPLTYLNFAENHPVVKQNLDKNILYGKPVVYVYYDSNNIIQKQPLIQKTLNQFKSKEIPTINL